MLIAVNRSVERHRRRLIVTVCAGALACAVMLTHGAMSGAHAGMGANGSMPMDPALAVCLAITETAAAGLAALALGAALRRARTWYAAPRLVVIRPPHPATVIPVGARAGPEVLQVFRT